MEKEKTEDGFDGPSSSRGKILMATVKGDVHDIGKNIVGVVLGCNSFEIIDLGVMVPCDKILDAAVEENADIIGLSGLITPSLDEMVHVAREMKRRKITIPLLIGGATTSAKHTAVKIAPLYDKTTMHVVDASKSVGVVEKLLDPKAYEAFSAENREQQAKLVTAFNQRSTATLISYKKAVASPFKTDWNTVRIDTPSFLGLGVIDDLSLEELVPFIDWSPLFWTWELKGKYPGILDDKRYGEQARQLFLDARQLLERIVNEKRFKARGVFGLWPAASDGDDIIVYADQSRTTERARLHTLRQQWQRKGQADYHALSDFVAPQESGREDHIGAFAVTTGHGVTEMATEFEADHDDYQSIMAKALADRLAEAFAEMLHKRVRAIWGYGDDENLDNDSLIREKYRGIRPAPGYPCQPDHTEKQTIFDLLEAESNTGIELTEHFAMNPAASVSGLYFAHPKARYFALDRLLRDQVKSYAERKGMSLAEVERWLAPNLGYDPA